MNDKLRKIINHYGIKQQLKYLQSEVFELTEAVIDKENRTISDGFRECCYNISKAFADLLSLNVVGYKDLKKEHIKEEITDVMVMLKQVQLYYNISSDEIKQIMKQKVERQIRRIEEGKEISKTEEVNKDEKI